MEKKDWMRCFACGHGTDVKPDEPFFQLIGPWAIMNGKPGESFSLFACPKCGTVRMERG